MPPPGLPPYLAHALFRQQVAYAGAGHIISPGASSLIFKLMLLGLSPADIADTMHMILFHMAAIPAILLSSFDCFFQGFNVLRA